MIELKLESCLFDEELNQSISVSFHPSFYPTYKHLKRWLSRFSLFLDESLINDLVLFYSLAKKKYLDHRNSEHLFRLVLSIYQVQRRLLSAVTLTSHARHLAVRWIPTELIFPFSSRPVLGCLVGFNLMDRCELFDEENILVALQKHFPNIQLVKESYYRHNSQHENIKILYFEIEKKDGTLFSLAERKTLKNSLEEKLRNSIQKLIPSVFMRLNQEEVYKNVLILSQEIASTQDIPQIYITMDQHTGKEIVFHITLVQIAPFHRFSFKERMFGCVFVLERVLPVRYLEGRQIEAYLFRLLLPFESSLLRSDGSLDFYAARKKVVGLLFSAVGEFRDYNGGLLIKQQELLFSFKKSLSQEAASDPELIETFFHALVPLEKQALLDVKVLSSLFTYFLEHRQEKLIDGLGIKIHRDAQRVFVLARGCDASMAEVISSVLRSHLLNAKDWAYNILETQEGTSFNCALLNASVDQVEPFIQALQDALYRWSRKRKNQQNLRIALGMTMFSLDPRVGGENSSSSVLSFLFEGLTRFGADGHVENAIAESIDISSDLKFYTFKLRYCLWNDGSLVSAHDFAYSWKKTLSPDFQTNFAAFFYPIKNAKEAKEGKISTEQIGIYVLDDQTIQVELVRPAPYFLQLTAHPIFSPVNRLVDQVCPQWPYQAEKNYPCNGPFQLKVNRQNQGYQLVKNPLYWDASQIRLDRITLTPMDAFQATQAFARNEIDWMGNPFGSWYPSYAPNKDAHMLSHPNSSVCWFFFNTSLAPFNHRKIRQAFSLAIDRYEIVKNAYLSLTPAYSVLHPLHCETGHPVFPEHDQEKALQLLHEALHELGLTANDLKIRLIFHQKGMQEHAAHSLEKQFKEKLGIVCQLQPLSWNAFFHKVIEGQFHVGLIHWTTPIDDPIYTLNAFRFAKEGVNFSKWENIDFQRCLDLSEEENNPFLRSSHLFEAEKILSQEMPVTPLFYQSYQATVRKNLQINYKQTPFGFFNLRT